MATRKPEKPDANSRIAEALRNATGIEQQSGEDLIGDGKLRQQFIDLKKRMAKLEAKKKVAKKKP